MPHRTSHPSLNWRLPAAAITLPCAALLLLAQLNHYALWDDEANTALFAKGICATGDTSAVIGHNLVAYEGGWELKRLRERYIPPLPAYLAAASFSIFGESAFAARLPFALCGIGFFAIVLAWLSREKADPWTCALVCFGLLTNVSLILYFRQARYYGVVIFLTTALAYFYLYGFRSRVGQLLLPTLAFALLASNYISLGAAFCCAAIDWRIWGRRRICAPISIDHPVRSPIAAPNPSPPTSRRFAAGRAALIFLFLLASAALIYTYNPLAVTQPAPPQATNRNELLQLWWNVRDLSVNEFCIVPLLAMVPLVGIWRRDAWLLRGGLTLVVYFAAINIVEPHHSSFAELRFLTPTIPLCLWLEIRALLGAVGKRKWIALLIALPIFGTNVLSGSTLFHPGLVNIPLRSTIWCYLRELADPPPDPYRAASDWLKANLPNDATVCVFPRFASYPLMFHAPRQIYGWQLDDPPKDQFKGLSDIQFVGRTSPEYLIVFGQEGLSRIQPIHLPDGTAVNYTLIKLLPVFAKDLFRPELYLRVFSTFSFNPQRDGIFILKKR